MHAMCVHCREFAQLEEDRRAVFPAMETGRKVNNGSLPMPVAVGRLITNAISKFNIRHDAPSDLHPVRDVIEPVNAMLDKLVVVPGADTLSREAQNNASLLLRAMIRGHLASKALIAKHRLTRAALSWLLGEIDTRFNISVAAGGEMCGVLAAQVRHATRPLYSRLHCNTPLPRSRSPSSAPVHW